MDKALYLGNHNTERNHVTIQNAQRTSEAAKVQKNKHKVPAATKHGYKANPGTDQPEAC
jgi:hypothetical protein